MTGPSPCRPRHSEGGFVLPYVLVVIAILAIAGTIAAQRLSRATAVMTEMQMKAASDQVLHSAEAAATYSLLTGNPIQGGYDLSPESPIVWEFGVRSADGTKALGVDDVDSLDSDFWPANGGLRRYTLNKQPNERSAMTLIRLQDASGLISLNKRNDTMLRSVLKASGANPAEASNIIDALADYIDTDDRRRNNGAEINDYRRDNMAPPSNSPLRSHEELGAVWGWEAQTKTMDLSLFKDLTTVVGTTGYRQEFATEAQIQALGLRGDSLLETRRASVIETIERVKLSTSSFARITLHVPRDDGRYDKRVVDIERVLGGVGTPYRRRWVYDATVLESDLEKNQDIPRGDNGLNLNGLKDVVHAAPSAR